MSSSRCVAPWDKPSRPRPWGTTLLVLVLVLMPGLAGCLGSGVLGGTAPGGDAGAHGSALDLGPPAADATPRPPDQGPAPGDVAPAGRDLGSPPGPDAGEPAPGADSGAPPAEDAGGSPPVGCGPCEAAPACWRSVCVDGACTQVPADGEPCDDGDGCTQGDSCSGGSCGGGPAVSCVDGLDCTDDTSSSTGPATCDCPHTLLPGQCLIGGACYPEGARDPADGCQSCLTGVSPLAWTYHLGLPEADAAPPGGASRRFDVAGLDCGACGAACDAAPDKCICQAEWSHLNYADSHFLGLGSEKYRRAAWAGGNFASVYVNALNDGWPGVTGSDRADQIEQQAEADFPSGVPEWFLLNEISSSNWQSDDAYRDFVVAVARRLHQTWGRSVVVFAPFPRPGHHWAQWPLLADTAFVGAECYSDTTGKQINAHGNSVAYVRGIYQQTIDAYAAVGVPLARLFLTEHYGNSINDPNINWGRCGVSADGWRNAILARGQAIRQLGFAGFASYGWGGNQMHDDSATRLSFEDAYASQSLP